MTENLPQFISIVFILTTFLTVGFLFYAIKQTVYDTIPAKIVLFLVPFWLFFQSILSLGGFYTDTSTVPPRMPIFAVLPAILLIVALFIFARKSFIEPLPLKILTLVSIIRIPVELVLLWLSQNKMVPRIMTFEGWNFDILSGIAAPIIFWLAFRNGKTNRKLLVAWNVFGLILLANIVTIAVLSLPSPIQKLAFEMPNRAVLYFPFIWLPAVVVPIVLFSHLASLWILLKKES
jgi:hypothetical protein